MVLFVTFSFEKLHFISVKSARFELLIVKTSETLKVV